MMWNEIGWIGERQRLYELKHAHPDWGMRAYAQETGHDPKWVRKWLKRFEGQGEITVDVLRSQSRRPSHSPHQIAARVKERIAELRETLSERFHRAAGARTIQYFLGKEVPDDTPLPGLRGIHRVLVERGYVRSPAKTLHELLVRPAPMEEWELDFGEIYLGPAEGSLEFLLVVDRGTSRVVYLEGSAGYRAESTIDAVLRLFRAHGRPKRLRFDRDPRLWGSWTRDSYPSPWVRLLHALDIEPIICPPHRPDKKPIVERCIGTLKYEWLARHSPATLADALALLPGFIPYHNQQRPHQGEACHHQIPDEAFPVLPNLPSLPSQVRPDAWLRTQHGRFFRRRVNASGSIQVDRHRYYVGVQFAGLPVAVQLDAQAALLHVVYDGNTLKSLPIQGLRPGILDLFEYIAALKIEAHAIEHYRFMNWYQSGETQ